MSGPGPMTAVRVVVFGHEIVHKVVHFSRPDRYVTTNGVENVRERGPTDRPTDSPSVFGSGIRDGFRGSRGDDARTRRYCLLFYCRWRRGVDDETALRVLRR